MVCLNSILAALLFLVMLLYRIEGRVLWAGHLLGFLLKNPSKFLNLLWSCVTQVYSLKRRVISGVALVLMDLIMGLGGQSLSNILKQRGFLMVTKFEQ
ncbi:hypothetical protein ES332_D11G252300v1 [Gossypium tomentosum]|uniref:Uncharacterized protein n=1 Tax=Gossypium tomentosum TaxID=34277 RepID=A0A5D2IRK5_GOSTO|nr:hypothetical protein ES332_D11G252300v1 [Gossypium tomentosum]